MCILCVRHGGIDADAKCPDAPDHNAQYDAESHASYVASWRAQSLCPSNYISWAGTHKHTHSLTDRDKTKLLNSDPLQNYYICLLTKS